MLESIALAYGLKIYSAYILNCTGTIKIFTDAKSLIYAKRNQTHSILLFCLNVYYKFCFACKYRDLSYPWTSKQTSRYNEQSNFRQFTVWFNKGTSD